MDYDGLFQDLMSMRLLAQSASGWCEIGNRWRKLALFIQQIDEFVEEIVSRN